MGLTGFPFWLIILIIGLCEVRTEIGANLELGTTALTKLSDGLIKTGVIILNGHDAFNTTHLKD